MALVGGAVRDLLLGRPPKELDVVVSADAGRFAGELLGLIELRGEGTPILTLHERFGTAAVVWPAGRIDVARRRAESYAVPGALPEVRPGTDEEDLARRDFTVNALAVPLSGQRIGRAGGRRPRPRRPRGRAAAGPARPQLHRRSHPPAAPRPLPRPAGVRCRGATRSELAGEALGAGALDTVSGGRVGAELRLALEEPDPLAALRSLGELGVLSALGLADDLDRSISARALELLPEDGQVPQLLLALLVLESVHGHDESEQALMREPARPPRIRRR